MSGFVLRLCSLLLFFSLTPFASTQDGKIAQFIDDLCGNPSVINPIVTLPPSTCLVTPGAGGLSIQLRPECPSGQKATLVLYMDTLCAAIDPRIWTDNSTCLAYSPSRSVPAVMFACGASAGDQPQATTTSTVAAGTAAAPSSTATSLTQDPTGSPISTTPTTLTTSATPAPSSPPSSSLTSTSGAGGNNNSNLPRAGQIALGVVLPLGAITVALLAWLYPKPWNKRGQVGK